MLIPYFGVNKSAWATFIQPRLFDIRDEVIVQVQLLQRCSCLRRFYLTWVYIWCLVYCLFWIVECIERMIDGDSPYVLMSATSSTPGDDPDDALLQENGPLTCWEPGNGDSNPALTVTILSDGNALVTNIVLSVRGVSLVELQYLPSAFSPVRINALLTAFNFCVISESYSCVHRTLVQC